MLPLSLGIGSIFIVLIGIVVNVYIILIISLTKQIAYLNKILLLHLGVVNTLICFTYLIFYAMSLLKLLVSVDIACILFGLSFNIMHSVVLWNLCAINFDRYFAIASPLHYGTLINTKKVLTSLGCGWLITILFGFPQLLRISPYYYDSYYELCLPNFKTIGSLLYNTSLTVFTVFLPIVLIFGCNMKVLMIARSQRHRIASAILEVTLSAQLTITHQRNPFFITSLYHPNVTNPGSPRINTHSPVSSIVQLVGSVITVYFPYYACILWNNLIEIVQREEQFMNEVKQNERALIPKVILQTATVLLLISPFVNALFYGIKNKHTRKTFHNIWRKQKSRIEIHYEIQARTPSTCGSRRPSITGANSTQPLLNKQLSETFLEISNADTNNKQSDNKLVSESRWTSNSRISNYSMLNSPTGDIENSTPRSLTSSEPNALELSAPGISVEPTKVTCTIRNAVKYYSSLSTNPKITITKTFSIEDPKSPKHEQLFSTATAEIKSVDSIETNDNLLLVGPTESFLETEIFNSILLTSKVQSSTFKKYSSLNDITRTAATICDILK